MSFPPGFRTLQHSCNKNFKHSQKTVGDRPVKHLKVPGSLLTGQNDESLDSASRHRMRWLRAGYFGLNPVAVLLLFRIDELLAQAFHHCTRLQKPNHQSFHSFVHPAITSPRYGRICCKKDPVLSQPSILDCREKLSIPAA